MKPVLYITALAAMSFLAAGFPGPVDPLSTMFFAATIFPVALISFVLGIRFGPAAPQGQHKGLYITISVLIVVTIIGAVAEFQRVASAPAPQRPPAATERLGLRWQDCGGQLLRIRGQRGTSLISNPCSTMCGRNGL